MAEAMDAADMPGLHSKLRKLHRNLSDDFSIFSTICQLFFVGVFTKVITDMFWTICHLAELIDLRCSAYIVEEDDPTLEPLQTLSRFRLVFSEIIFELV